MYWYGKGFQFISSKNISRRKLVPVAASRVDNLNFTPFVPFEFCIIWIYFFLINFMEELVCTGGIILHPFKRHNSMSFENFIHLWKHHHDQDTENIYIISKDSPWHFAVHLSLFPGPSQPLNCFLSLEVSVYLI